MSERLYLFLIGACILLALYLTNNYLIYGLSLFLLLEGISGIRLTLLIQKARRVSLDADMVVSESQTRFGIDVLSAWRVFVAIVMLSSYLLIHEYGYEMLWFIPWFMGFSIMGAGATRVCPVLFWLHRVGFK
ncbi:MAG: hypothetical protein HKP12_06190 [Gammaproteobacteria bacterium]|nr:hypothetical protein [Gammaproteobacteria bacterium]